MQECVYLSPSFDGHTATTSAFVKFSKGVVTLTARFNSNPTTSSACLTTNGWVVMVMESSGENRGWYIVGPHSVTIMRRAQSLSAKAPALNKYRKPLSCAYPLAPILGTM